MSSFAENLQFYRKRENMTQEQLAEKLEVSRQTISKWEAGASYPEMEKLLQLCELFSSSMDTLMRENAAETEVEDNESYDRHMEKRRMQISVGVVILIASVALYELLAGFRVAEPVCDTVFMGSAMIGILVLVVAGMQHENYRRKHPFISNFYSQEVIDQFDEKFPIRIAAGIGMLLIGLLIAMNGEHLPLGAGIREDFYYGIFLLLVAIAVGIMTYAGIGKEKYNLEAYNKENQPNAEAEKANQKTGVFCGCIMLAAAILFFVWGQLFGRWDVSWLAFLIGGILCGIVSLILSLKKEE